MPIRVPVRHHDESIEKWQILRFASGLRLVPQLESPAPLGLPIFAKVVKGRHTALEVAFTVLVEVGVEREMASRQGQ